MGKLQSIKYTLPPTPYPPLSPLSIALYTSVSMQKFSTIPEALEELKKGNFIIVTDDENRENEGDLILPAEKITDEKMAFLIRQTGGVVCLSLSNEIADKLDLPPMVPVNTSLLRTPFTVSIDAAQGISTGISAPDRTVTVLATIKPDAKPEDFRRPGHVFPLRAQEGGVLVRAGHTEAAVDLCRLAGFACAGLISELMHEDGSMMRLPALQKFAEQNNLSVISIADLIAWRRKHETAIHFEAESELETDDGLWKIRVYEDLFQHKEHVALIKGKISKEDSVLVRVHSECLTGDVFHSHHCDCGQQLDHAMKMIEREGNGVILYMRQEGRGIGLANKVRAYKLQQEEGLDTVEANEKLGFPSDLREYGIGAQILKDVGVHRMRLLTNNPKKIVGLEGYDLKVDEQIPIEISFKSDRQKKYMKTKKEKMGHLFRHV